MGWTWLLLQREASAGSSKEGAGVGRRGISKALCGCWAGAGSCLPCLAEAVLLAQGCRDWDPIFPWAKWVPFTCPAQLLP